MKDNGIAVAYQQVINDYLDKKYFHRVTDDEPTPEYQLLLLQYSVLRPKKVASKVRIVFVRSAPFEVKSLKTEALSGLKL